MIRSAVIAAAVMVALLLGAVPAQADPTNDVVRELTIDIEIDDDGVLHVREGYEWDFGHREGLGLRRMLAQRFAWPEDPDLMRIYEYDDIAVTSPSGAPDQVWVAADGSYLELHIGAPDGSDETRSGVQTYELRYTVAGAMNAIRGHPEVPDQDELFWNVTGSQWDVRIEQVITTVTGPTDITGQRCWQGSPSSDQPCPTQVEGASATFTAGPLPPGQEQTIAVAFPPGTFGDIDPILVPAAGEVAGLTANQQRIATVTDPMAETLGRFWPIPVVLIAAVLVLLTRRRLREGRDDHFVGLPPGTIPSAAERDCHPVAQLERQPTVTVRFTPPERLRPAEVGWLEHRIGAPDAIAATLVDLAVRGFLTIREARTSRRGKPLDWELIRNPQANERREELTRHEAYLLSGVFADGPTVGLRSLRNSFTWRQRAVTKALGEQIDAHRLFVRPVSFDARLRQPMTRRGKSLILQSLVVAILAAAAAIGGGADLLPPSAVTLLMVLASPFALWLVIRAATAKTSLRRTATGRALYDQARGFQLYLSRAKADQIRMEEEEDVFSRYLPYAITFGVAERWAKIFAELQAQGRAVPQTGWYIGSRPGMMDMSSFGSAMSSFTGTTSATLGSGGGSGFSGGGAGGGGGGGGGGGR